MTNSRSKETSEERLMITPPARFKLGWKYFDVRNGPCPPADQSARQFLQEILCASTTYESIDAELLQQDLGGELLPSAAVRADT